MAEHNESPKNFSSLPFGEEGTGKSERRNGKFQRQHLMHSKYEGELCRRTLLHDFLWALQATGDFSVPFFSAVKAMITAPHLQGLK